jgi:hypothetical protein
MKASEKQKMAEGKLEKIEQIFKGFLGISISYLPSISPSFSLSDKIIL